MVQLEQSVWMALGFNLHRVPWPSQEERAWPRSGSSSATTPYPPSFFIPSGGNGKPPDYCCCSSRSAASRTRARVATRSSRACFANSLSLLFLASSVWRSRARSWVASRIWCFRAPSKSPPSTSMQASALCCKEEIDVFSGIF